MSKMTAKEKGILNNPNLAPCNEPLPRTAFTEWLHLDSSANVSAIVDVHGGVISEEDKRDSKNQWIDSNTLSSKRVVFTPSRKEKTNRDWLENELKAKERRNPDTVYQIVLSSCGKFGCLCKFACTRNANRKKV